MTLTGRHRHKQRQAQNPGSHLGSGSRQEPLRPLAGLTRITRSLLEVAHWRMNVRGVCRHIPRNTRETAKALCNLIFISEQHVPKT